MSTQRPTGNTAWGLIVWPILLVIIGVLLLLSNFLLLGSFAITDLWPLLLVLVGAQILVRGDLIPNSDSRTFGITRGSVEEGTLEVSSGEVDVSLRALPEDFQDRLVAGQFAPKARPQMEFTGNHAHLKMHRNQTPWLAFTDWEIGIARGMPWRISVSTFLGQVLVDASGLILNGALIATGISDIYVNMPAESFDTIAVQSTTGNIHITTPAGHKSRIHVSDKRFSTVHIDLTRYQKIDDTTYESLDSSAESAVVEVSIFNTFGDVYLA